MVTDSASVRQPLGFAETLRRRARETNSWLCLGLDPDPELLPDCIPYSAEGVAHFCREIVLHTADRVAAFKLNFAFFEALGPDGWSVLERVRLSVPSEVPVIADAKRADIPNTSRFYARAVFDSLNCDAVTLNPYLGWESIEPFLEWKGKGALILTRTSNPGAADPQELTVNGEPLYLHVARRALLQGGPQVGLVVGATEPEAVRRVRGLDPDAILLLVGVGAQGASLADAMSAGAGRDGENALIGMSRHILYASRGRDFAEAARQATEEANSRMQTSR